MWQKVVIATVILASLYTIAQVQSEVHHPIKKRDAHYCGPMLSNILSELCKGLYNGSYRKKSYPSDNDLDYSYRQYQQYVEDARFPFKSKSNAAALISGSFRRYTRGVYDECCTKSCTATELLSYCASS